MKVSEYLSHYKGLKIFTFPVIGIIPSPIFGLRIGFEMLFDLAVCAFAREL